MNTNVNQDRGSMTDRERTMERVRKLLAIAEDSRADSNEAAAAAAMAEKIMRKFSIEHADVLATEIRRKDAASFDEGDCSAVMKRGLVGKAGEHKPTKVPPWAQYLAVRIGQLNDCKVILKHTIELGACIRFQGFKSDVEISRWMFNYLADAMIKAVRRWQQEEKRLTGAAASKDASHSYRAGFIAALNSSLVRAKREKDAEMQEASSSRALVIVKAQAVAERFGADNYKNTKAKAISRGDAFHAGRTEGSKVDVTRRAIGGSPASPHPQAQLSAN